jgi:G protein-coupled receptor Mth (Methuselah protein)
MGVPWTTEIITFLAESSFESALFTNIFNIISPLFIFIIFVCKPSAWKMFIQLKFPRMSPFISTCENPKKINHHQSAISAEDSCNSNVTGSSNNKTSQQTLSTESTDTNVPKQVLNYL